MPPLPARRVLAVDADWYAYDLNTQQLVAVAPPLAALLRGEKPIVPAARRALRRARQRAGLFLAPRTRLVSRTEVDQLVDRDLQHLVLTVTEACNLRCAYCLHGAKLGWVRPHGSGAMTMATALAATEYFLDRRDGARTPVISFYGGEALLNREVITGVIAAARAHARGVDTIFIVDTNGVLLDAGVADWVLQSGVHLQISIDGAAAQHDRYRVDQTGKSTFDRIMANISYLLDRDPGVADRLSYIVTLAPPVDLFAVAEFFRCFPPYLAQGVATPPRLTVNFANLQGQDWPRNLESAVGLPAISVQVEQARREYLRSLAVGRRNDLSPVIRALFEPELIRLHHRSRSPLGATFAPGANCRPGRRKLHVTAAGRLQPCERTGEVMSLGTIKTGIEGPAVARLYGDFHQAVRDRCGRCWALRLCSVCFAAQAENADLTTGQMSVPSAVCRRVRSGKEQSLKMLVQVLAMSPASRRWLDDTSLS